MKKGKQRKYVFMLFLMIAFLALRNSAFGTTVDSLEKIVVGADFDYKPYSYLNDNGEAKGFDVDIIKAIAEKYDIELEFRFTRWDKALENLNKGKVDVLISVLYTEQRDTMYDYTIPYNEDYYGIFVREESEVKDISGLSKKQILALKGDASITRFIKPMALFENTTLASSLPKAIRLLSEGKGDAVLAPYSIGMEAINDLGIKNVKVEGPSIMPILYRFAVKEGDAQLLSLLNDGIDHVKVSGKKEKLVEKWDFHKRDEVSLEKVMRYVGIGLIPVLLIFLILALWSRSLNKSVKRKTKILQERTASLEKLNATKDKLFSVIAHDLRAPFSNILGLSGIMMEDVGMCDTSKLEYFSKSINATANHTLNLLDNLLYWAKSQTNQLKYKPVPLKLEETISHTLIYSEVSANVKNISLNHVRNYETEVYADEIMLSTVLRNLVSNAIKFTYPNGRINVYTTHKEKEAEVTVSDNG
ncbi:MAG: transporter substrate-binding domain-containing protein, partial [Bacteroidota bacterium]